MRMSRFLIILALLIPLVAGCLRQDGSVNSQSAEGLREAPSLFALAMERPGTDWDARINAASVLARCRGADSWIILMLTAGVPKRTDLSDSDDIRAYVTQEESRHRPIIAAILESLPEDTAPSVLWAVTLRNYLKTVCFADNHRWTL